MNWLQDFMDFTSNLPSLGLKTWLLLLLYNPGQRLNPTTTYESMMFYAQVPIVQVRVKCHCAQQH
jgi:hypothetical protein